ncbi:hypothetical protein KSX_48270 [Ktedonospora formicarum]|uniref:Uncharacterized protein n=1 Tax=Ktedonospora formicarum TaxID=2778364 RepID=A0A8J3HZM7_9CHLR|nr:hypothetical protein KSX_48270 [Ktedonospora formicarum]
MLSTKEATLFHFTTCSRELPLHRDTLCEEKCKASYYNQYFSTFKQPKLGLPIRRRSASARAGHYIGLRFEPFLRTTTNMTGGMLL